MSNKIIIGDYNKLLVVNYNNVCYEYYIIIITVQLEVLETCGAIILINENVVFQLCFNIDS